MSLHFYAKISGEPTGVNETIGPNNPIDHGYLKARSGTTYTYYLTPETRKDGKVINDAIVKINMRHGLLDIDTNIREVPEWEEKGINDSIGNLIFSARVTKEI